MEPSELSKDASDITSVRARSEGRTITISKMYKDGSIIKKEDLLEELIEVTSFPSDVPMAEVGISSSMTINLGNFESVKIGITVSLPSSLPELEEAFRTAKKFVDGKLNAEVAEIREYRKKRLTEWAM